MKRKALTLTLVAALFLAVSGVLFINFGFANPGSYFEEIEKEVPPPPGAEPPKILIASPQNYTLFARNSQNFVFVVQAVDWGELDFLLVDLPPGTGDAQLSLCQTVPLDGGVIVTTPQEASLGVVRKGIAMFEKVNVPILGIVENMSYFTTPNGERVEIFGYGGGRAEAERQKIPFLGEVPIFTEIREGGDAGLPVAISSADKPAGLAFIKIAEALQRRLAV